MPLYPPVPRSAPIDEDLEEALSDAVSNGEGRLYPYYVRLALARAGLYLTPIPPGGQSAFASSIETVTGRLVGLGLATILNYLILPLYGFDIHMLESLSLGAIFTLVSMVYSYLWRRLFNLLATKGILA